MRRAVALRVGAAVVLAALGVVLAVWSRTPQLPPVPPRPIATGDAAVVERFECHRCHEAEGALVPTSREGSCVTCHRAIRAGDFDGMYEPERLARWREHATSLLGAPSLGALGRRLRRSWVTGFLRAPHDLRPGLPASMPRLRLSEADIEAIARHFALTDAEGSAPTGDVSAGRALFLARGCPGCHAFGGAGTPSPPPVDLRDPASDARMLAPDLRATRDRMTAATVDAWLADPRALDPAAHMPAFESTASEREDLAAFILAASLDEVPAAPPLVRLPLLTRRVTHREVDEAVFHRTCRHCHADPIPTGGDGGPGNTGGFGFAPRGLDLSTYEAIDRRRDALLSHDETGEPLLVAALLRRHGEVRGTLVERRGMPLGLPPVSPEALQLIESWVAQGAPRE